MCNGEDVPLSLRHSAELRFSCVLLREVISSWALVVARVLFLCSFEVETLDLDRAIRIERRSRASFNFLCREERANEAVSMTACNFLVSRVNKWSLILCFAARRSPWCCLAALIFHQWWEKNAYKKHSKRIEIRKSWLAEWQRNNEKMSTFEHRQLRLGNYIVENQG